MNKIKIKIDTLLNLIEYINEKEWVTLKDKEGEPYHVKLEKKKDSIERVYKKGEKSDTKNKQSNLKEDKKEKYKLKEGSKVTQKRFNDLFGFASDLDNHPYTKTVRLDNKHTVEYDKKRALITFYELGDLSEDKDYSTAPKGTLAMLPKFRTDDYNKLVDYLFETNQEWRLNRNKGN